MKVEDKNLKTLAAAYLYVKQERSQTEIAELLGVSQAGVSRMLNQARQQGLIRERIELVTDSVDAEDWRKVEQIALGCRIGDALERFAADHGVKLEEIRVFYSGSDRLADFDRRLTRFGSAAASSVSEMTLRASTIGVTWGMTLAGLVAGLRETHTVSDEGPRVRCIPTSGEPLGAEVSPISSSFLARELDAVLNGPRIDRRSQLSLAGVPAIIPISYLGTERFEVIRDFIREGKAYREIFGGRDPAPPASRPLIEEIDLLLTSMGSSERPLNMYDDELVVTGGIDRVELSELILCDLGGVLIPKPGLGPAQSQRVRDISGLWTGLTREHLEECARKGREEGRPGVVVLAISKRKAEGLLECIRQGLVNSVVIDHDLAGELGRLLGE